MFLSTMEPKMISCLILCILASCSSADIAPQVGINYGVLGDNLPTPKRSVELVKRLKAKRVKIYDANPDILTALKNTRLQVSIMVPNQLITNLSTNQTLADQWVQKNLVPFYPQTAIGYLLVGNEILSQPDKQLWNGLVPAMRRVQKALVKFGISKVKVGTPLAMDLLEASFPPSEGRFRSDALNSVIKPMLQFLDRTKSFLFLDVYTYFTWASQPNDIKLDYALLDESKNITFTDPNTGLTYTNLLDQMLDAVLFAVKRVGFPDIRLFIAETGWPNGGDIDQIGANVFNAATFNRNLVKKLMAKPVIGTPARPGSVIPGFIFSLYNENMKPGPGTERHFGLFYPNETNIFSIDLSGQTKLSDYPQLTSISSVSSQT